MSDEDMREIAEEERRDREHHRRKPIPQQAVDQSTIARNGEVHTQIVGEERGQPSVQVIREDEMWAEVEVGIGATFNMGDFNSMRIDVRVRRPCKNTDEAIAEMANRIKDFDVRRLDQEREDLLGSPVGEHIRRTKGKK